MMLEHETLLLSIIRECGGIEGRKKFQKMMCIVKEMGYPVRERFAWANYGVYSPELQSEIDSLVRDENISEDNVSGSGQPPEYRYALCQKGADLLRRIEMTAEARESGVVRESNELMFGENENLAYSVGNNDMKAMLSFIRFLNSNPVEKLELWSSILFLRKTEKNTESLVSFLHYLKRHFSESEIREGIREVDEVVLDWEFKKKAEIILLGATDE
jgi:uncharacterized protein YwgA